jgi:predicted aconitase with swiveling domain
MGKRMARPVEKRIQGRALVAAAAGGPAVVSGQPISFWGGVSPKTGEVIDRRHELAGRNLSGKIFVFPFGKGSSTASAILLEGIRSGSAPAGIINTKVDPILSLGAVVAQEMYARTIPVVVISETDFDFIQDGDHLEIETDGTISIRPPAQEAA